MTKCNFLGVPKLVIPLTAALFAAAVTTGCSTTAGIEAAGKMATSQGQPALSNKVMVNNGSLGRSVEVVDLKTATAGDLMIAQVVLRSKDRDTLPLQYNFVWVDASGIEIADHSGWTPLLVYGKETKVVQAVAPDRRATACRLLLREPDHE